MMVVAHNLLAMNGERMLGINTKAKAKSTEKLSSGYRVNRAADDAAGLAISEKLRRQIRGLNQGAANCQDGVSFNQIADGAMNEVSDMLHRMEELAVKAANGTLNDEDREYIQSEIAALKDEVDRVSNTTTFNELPVFGTHVKKTTYASVVAGAAVVEQEEYYIDGKTMGLAAVLNSDGENHISTVKKLQDPVQFSGGGWVSTGKTMLYGSSLIDGHSYGRQSLDAVLTQLERFASVDAITSSAMQGYINRGEAGFQQDQGTNRSLFHVDYVKNIVSGDKIPSALSVENFIQDSENPGNWIASGTRTYYLSEGVPGVSAYDDGMEYPSVWMDFSGLGKPEIGYTVESLYGLGFNSSCCTCGKYYSVEFTDSSLGKAFELSGEDKNPVLKIDISGCSSGSDLVHKIMDAVMSTSSNSFTNHYQQYAYNIDNPDKLYVYDNRYWQYPRGGSSSFEPVVRDIEGQIKSKNVIVNMTNGQRVVHESEDIWIQAGTEAHSGFYLKRACINTSYLGLSGADVDTVDGANDLIEAIKGANRTLSSERAMVGAQQNRCEKAINVNRNSSENTTAAESRIRDTDMAKEMVTFSNQNIIQQAGQTMLAQANQSKQGVLSLLS